MSSTEHWSLIGSVGVVAIVAVAVLARRIGLAARFALVIAGFGLSRIPGSPQVEPERILAGVPPPVLHAATPRMPVADPCRDTKAIGLLAFVLVVATPLSAGLLVDALLPGPGLPVTFALGPTSRPTDAVAASEASNCASTRTQSTGSSKRPLSQDSMLTSTVENS